MVARNSTLRRGVRRGLVQERAAAKAHLYRRWPAFRHSNCTVLEFWNLAERIEDGVREHVRRGFVVAEGHEHGALRHAIVSARVERNLPAARLDRDRVARLGAELFEIEWMH